MDYRFLGEFSSSTTYMIKDVVSYAVDEVTYYYMCLRDNTVGQVPVANADSTYWGLMNTNSNFPNELDSFVFKADIQASDQTDINRIVELKRKTTLTPTEQIELNTLTLKHKNKFQTADDINKMQNSLMNLQLFFKDKVEGRLEQRLQEINTYLDSTDAGDMRTDIGVMADLSTTNKSSLVNALNEVNNKPSIHIGVNAPANGEFWLDGNAKLNYKDVTGVWKGVAPSQSEFNANKGVLENVITNQLLQGDRLIINIKDDFDNNIDNVKGSGFYCAEQPAKGTLPISNSNSMILITNKKFIYDGTKIGVVQEILYTITGKMFRRVLVDSGSWSSWKEITPTENINDSTSTTTLFVDGTNGTDSPGKGTSSGTGAFKTIQYAVSQVKRLNIGDIEIRVANGTYNESVTLNGFLGGKISIIGNGTGTVIKSLTFSNMTKIDCQSFNVTEKIEIMTVSLFSLFTVNKTTSTSGIHGVRVLASNGMIGNNVISNCGSASAIYVDNNSSVYLDSVSGSGNGTGITCVGSVVRKNSVSVTGTTPQVVSGGGQIL